MKDAGLVLEDEIITTVLSFSSWRYCPSLEGQYKMQRQKTPNYNTKKHEDIHITEFCCLLKLQNCQKIVLPPLLSATCFMSPSMGFITFSVICKVPHPKGPKPNTSLPQLNLMIHVGLFQLGIFSSVILAQIQWTRLCCNRISYTPGNDEINLQWEGNTG